MHLKKLECQGFRCLRDVCFKPSPGLNVIRGSNAQGKTTVLEAILFAATSKSHRTNLESDLPQYGSQEFHIRLDAQRSDREVVLEANWWRNVKRFKINGVPQTRLSEILGRVHVVFFCPEDVDLIRGGASGRRYFLDMEISQIHPGYLNALQQYRQALRQRNELLRGLNPDPDLLAVWDVQLAQHGALLIGLRTEYIAGLSGHAAQAYERIAEAEALSLAYQPDVDDPSALESVLARSRVSDIKRRVTQRGPHRDDIEIRVAERPARSHASQGQQKTAALAMKLAELELVKARAGEYPILMLDEVLSELDAERAHRLFAAIGQDAQCIMTTTELDRRADRFDAPCTAFRIERGSLEKED
jgi:DNA replication and repair protein RecF